MISRLRKLAETPGLDIVNNQTQLDAIGQSYNELLDTDTYTTGRLSGDGTDEGAYGFIGYNADSEDYYVVEYYDFSKVASTVGSVLPDSVTCIIVRPLTESGAGGVTELDKYDDTARNVKNSTISGGTFSSENGLSMMVLSAKNYADAVSEVNEMNAQLAVGE